MRLYILLAFGAVLTVAYAVTPSDVLGEEWRAFKIKHNKNYKDEIEEQFRKKIFTENKHKIAKHNQRFLLGVHKYDLAMNEFGDLLHHEFVAVMNGFKRNYRERNFNGSSYLSPSFVKLPDEVNWVTKGYVTPVKNQGQCGSCWSFSATGSLEGQHMKQTGQLVSLSEQNLVDCSGKYGNEGCSGGLMDQAFQYIKDNKGLDTEASYPYKAEEGKCHFNRRTVGATDTGFMDIDSGSEEKLQEAVATVGPISVAIDASHESFQFYSKGVYDEPECSSEDLDHGVLAVGYGSQNGQDYWLVKNSWGDTWGDQGYVRMTRNKNNQCGIATSASYPLV